MKKVALVLAVMVSLLAAVAASIIIVGYGLSPVAQALALVVNAIAFVSFACGATITINKRSK